MEKYQEDKIILDALKTIKDFGKEDLNSRLHYNMKIISKLTDYCYTHKNVRFNQALFNLGITKFSEETNEHLKKGTSIFTSTLEDLYGEESSDTFKKLKYE